MKKAQTSVYISMAVLVLVLVFFLIIAKLNTVKSGIVSTESTSQDYTNTFMSVATQTLPYITYNGIPLQEFFGVFACYGNNSIDYGVDHDFTFSKVMEESFDPIFGEDQWAMQIYTEIVKSEIPELVFIADCSGSMTGCDVQQRGPPYCENGISLYVEAEDDIKVVTEAKDIISPKSFVRCMSTMDREATKCRYGTRSGRKENEENWAGTAEYICNNGPPPDYPGTWPDGLPKYVVVSSDEGDCSSPNPWTKEYVDHAIEACNAAGIKIIYLLPPNIPEDNPGIGIGELPIEEAKRLAESTGGKLVDITTAEEVAAEIKEDIKINVTRAKQVTSKQIGDIEPILEGKEYLSYTFVFPLPCDEYSIGRANLLYLPKDTIHPETSQASLLSALINGKVKLTEKRQRAYGMQVLAVEDGVIATISNFQRLQKGFAISIDVTSTGDGKDIDIAIDLNSWDASHSLDIYSVKIEKNGELVPDCQQNNGPRPCMDRKSTYIILYLSTGDPTYTFKGNEINAICKHPGQKCSLNSDCCYTTCEQDVCTTKETNCIGECKNLNYQCCVVRTDCSFDSLGGCVVKDEQPPPPEPPQPSPSQPGKPCKDQGESCALSSNCCTGKCRSDVCVEIEGDCKGSCSDQNYLCCRSRKDCGIDSQGNCVVNPNPPSPPAPKPSPPTACKNVGETCSQNSECCHGKCENNACAYKKEESCQGGCDALNYFCCNARLDCVIDLQGNCVVNPNPVPPPGCIPEGNECGSTSTCCKGTCTNGVCV